MHYTNTNNYVYAKLPPTHSLSIINPCCAWARDTVIVQSVCCRANCYIRRLFVESRVPLSFLCWFQHTYCVGFIENVLFESFGDICWQPLPSPLLDQLSMDNSDNSGFFSRRLVCRTIDSSYDSSPVTVDYQQSFWLCVAKLLTRHAHIRTCLVMAVHACALVSADHKFYIQYSIYRSLK